jgi:hypothetical protein
MSGEHCANFRTLHSPVLIRVLSQTVDYGCGMLNIFDGSFRFNFYVLTIHGTSILDMRGMGHQEGLEDPNNGCRRK